MIGDDKKQFLSDLADRVESTMKTKGLKHKDVSDIVIVRGFADWRNRCSAPSVITVARLAERLEVSLEWLVLGKEREKRSVRNSLMTFPNYPVNTAQSSKTMSKRSSDFVSNNGWVFHEVGCVVTKKDFLISLALRAESVMKEKEMTHKDIADVVAMRGFSDWKHRGSAPSVWIVARLAERLGVSLDYLVWGKEAVSVKGLSDKEKEAVEVLANMLARGKER